MDTTELEVTRQAIRTEKEQSASQTLHTIYGKHFNLQMLAQSRKDVSDLLDEIAEPMSIRRKLRQLQQEEHGHSFKVGHSQTRQNTAR